MTSCPSLASTLHPATPPFESLSAAAFTKDLLGDGLVATSCVPKRWNYLFTRSTSGNYPRGTLSTFFKREQSVANCPYGGWDAPYLSDTYLDRPPGGCGVVIDVGANIGLAVLPPASLGWQVLAFEPNVQNVDRLRLNLAINQWGAERVSVVTAAVADRNGTATLFTPPSKHAAISSLSTGNVAHFKRTKSDDIGQAPTRLLRLDEYISGAAPGLWNRVRVVKIDTQGHELPVLMGMGALLGAPPYPVILMEFEVPMQQGAGFGDGTRVLQYLAARGCALARTQTHTIAPCSLRPMITRMLSSPHHHACISSPHHHACSLRPIITHASHRPIITHALFAP